MAYGGVSTLALGIAYWQQMHVRTAVSMAAALKKWPGEVKVCVQASSYLHWNREFIVQQALEAKASHLWFLDTDMIFPPAGLFRLADLDKDIVGGSYNFRQLPLRSVVKLAEVDGVFVDATEENMPKEPFQCAVVPTGFMLINLARLVAKVQPPYFESNLPLGDDVYFCKKVRAAGLEVWCDPTIEIGHVGEMIF